MMSDSFQIIASGPDGLFGQEPSPAPVLIAFPAATRFPIPGTNNSLELVSPDDPLYAKPHADNLTNFADRDLAAAAENLLQE